MATQAPSRVLRATTVFSHTDSVTGDEVLVSNDNIHDVLENESDEALDALAAQGWITLTDVLPLTGRTEAKAADAIVQRAITDLHRATTNATRAAQRLPALPVLP